MLKDFLDYLASRPEETVTWELGGRAGTYRGRMAITKTHSTNPNTRDYRDLYIKTDGMSHPFICSADVESPFSRTYTIRDGKIIKSEAA
jgi:hypothetical protein